MFDAPKPILWTNALVNFINIDEIIKTNINISTNPVTYFIENSASKGRTIATLEEKLEFDPFTIMDEPLYPSTFGEFVSIYEKLNPNK